MKATGQWRRGRAGARGALLLSAFLCLVLGGAALFTLRADSGSKGDLSHFQAGEGTPTRGESGWVNLPYLGGLTRLKASEGKLLFEGMANLYAEGLLPKGDGTAGASFVLEGTDAYLAPSLVFSGSPVVTVTALPKGWQALFFGPFAASVDPLLVKPTRNNLGFFMPTSLDGAVMRLSTPGLPSLYALVDGHNLLLSWQALVNLALEGHHQVTFEAYSTQAGYFKAVIDCSKYTGALVVTFGK